MAHSPLLPWMFIWNRYSSFCEWIPQHYGERPKSQHMRRGDPYCHARLPFFKRACVLEQLVPRLYEFRKFASIGPWIMAVHRKSGPNFPFSFLSQIAAPIDSCQTKFVKSKITHQYLSVLQILSLFKMPSFRASLYWAETVLYFPSLLLLVISQFAII